MEIEIQEEMMQSYPQAQIGYLIAKVAVREQDPYVERLKEDLGPFLANIGINATTFAAHPSVAIWRKIYEEDLGVKAKTYRSSLEALMRRVSTGKGIWQINNVVDLYNCCSIFSLLPMGGYDLNKISGDISIRYARKGEAFRGLNEREEIQPAENHIVYADGEKLLCWLWNHKDAEMTAIDEETKRVIFFIDSAEEVNMQMALDLLSKHLKEIGSHVLQSGVLNQKNLKRTI